MGGKPNRYTNVARFYDYDASERMNKDIPFYLDYAKRLDANNILDLCCGTGRVSIPLAREGYSVVALDLSDAMLSVFRGKLPGLSGDVRSRIKIISGDATDFALKTRFELAVIPYRSFQQFAHRVDALNCLRCVRSHLTDNGLFIISIFRPERELDETWVYPKTKQWQISENGETITKFHWGQSIDLEHHLIRPVLCYEVSSNGDKNVVYEDLTLKYYYRAEVEEMIRSEGFKILDIFGDYEGGDAGAGNDLIFVCAKSE